MFVLLQLRRGISVPEHPVLVDIWVVSHENVTAGKFRSGEEEARSYARSEEGSAGQLLGHNSCGEQSSVS